MKRHSRKPEQLLLAATLALLLTACGGGGGGGGDNNPPPSGSDDSPDAFSFSPAQINDAEPGETYEATATITGFDGELSARIISHNGKAEFSLVDGDDEVNELDIKSGDTIRVRAAVSEEASFGEQTQVTVKVGEGDEGVSDSFRLIIADVVAPEVGITFPTSTSITHDEALTLTGTWSDNSGDIESLVLVHNGQQLGALPSHAIFEDGTFQIDMTLVAEDNEISVAAMDANGLVSDSSTVNIKRESALSSNPQSVVFHQESKLMYMLDIVGTRTDILEVNTENGFVRRVASSGDTNAGEEEQFDGRLLLHDNNTKLLVLDAGQNNLVAIDIQSGERTVLASGFVEGIAIENGPDGSVFLLAKFGGVDRFAVGKFDADSNELSVMSRPGTDGNVVGGGSTTTWISPVDIAYDAANDFLYLVDHREGQSHDPMYRIVNTGSRLPVEPTGPRRTPDVVAIAALNGAVYVATENTDRDVFVITPDFFDASGFYAVRRTNLGSDNGVEIAEPRDLVVFFRDDAPVLWELDEGAGHQPVVEVVNSVGTAVVAQAEVAEIGSGPGINSAARLLVDQTNDRLLVLEDGYVRSVNLSSGNRSERLLDPDQVGIRNMQIHDGDLYFNVDLDTGTEGGVVGLDILEQIFHTSFVITRTCCCMRTVRVWLPSMRRHCRSSRLPISNWRRTLMPTIRRLTGFTRLPHSTMSTPFFSWIL